MPTWLSVLLLIVIVLAAGFLRDAWRTRAIRRWCDANGFQVISKTPEDVAALTVLAQRFRPYNVRQWGIVLRKEAAGVQITFAEHAETPRTGIRWHTLAATRVPGRHFDAVRILPAPSQFLRGATDSISAPGREIRERLGIEISEIPAIFPIGRGRWAVETEDAAARTFWSSEAQAAEVDEWPQNGEFAAVDDAVLVRVAGLMRASRLDDLLRLADEARARFERAIVQSSRPCPAGESRMP